MNYPSQKLCQELFEVSKWVTSIGEHYCDNNGDVICPKYSLSYMLRKLPSQLSGGGLLYIGVTVSGKWSCGHRGSYYRGGKTPEDAACKLAIELFNQGVLI